MRCVVPGRSLKLFAKAIHCLSKIGEELYLEALPDGLALRTVNLSRSAYACFKFHSSFFLSYDDGSKDLTDESQAEDMLKCKIAMKSCLSAFKSMNTIEKSVDRCRIDLNVSKARLVFLLFCKHGITKTHNLTFQECETLQAVFTKDLCPNFITTQPKVLMDTVSNFPNNQEELSLTVTPEVIRFKNYTDDEPDPNKVIHTQTSLSPDEFNNYQIGVDTDVTFCLKELRAILAFGEYSGQPINIHFETGGKPIVFSMDADSTYEADFVLATLVDELPSSSQSSQTSTTAKSLTSNKKSSQNPRIPNGKLIANESNSLASKQPKTNVIHDKEAENDVARQHGDHNDDDDDMADEEMNELVIPNLEEAEPEELPFGSKRYSSVSLSKAKKEGAVRQGQDVMGINKKLSKIPKTSQEKSMMGLNVSANPIQTPPSSINDVSFLNNVDMPSLGNSFSSQKSPQFGKKMISQSKKHQSADDSCATLDDDDYDFVPGTPPSKKFKSMFFGTHSESHLQIPKAPVLAADTDDEDSD
ncbi:cell cycle checkpoint control protein RAD9A-like isoform X2 [Actinia tenebrosa]|uniref:Cell cycle checkpoint control protein RAD9A n=1 Tax=Actinia tenebrosa TaxID=6105 RepID=A0A6P8HWI2_ACTTE|nr:cell cycle checkpoint control protein RAD9A-like isoform X2 [Actinia tenebrosa]